MLLSAVMMMERSVQSFETDRDISKYKGDISDINGLINDQQRWVMTRRHFVSFRQRAVAILFSNMCQAVFLALCTTTHVCTALRAFSLLQWGVLV